MKRVFLLFLLLSLIIFGCVSTEKTTKEETPAEDKVTEEVKEEVKAVEPAGRAVPAFIAVKATTVPVIDGVLGKDEWKEGNMYSLGYNQLNVADLRPPKDQNDISGDWTVLYNGKTLYGMVIRKDDKTFTGAENVWESDCVEVMIEQKGKFVQLRTLIGEDFASAKFAGVQKAVWSADGTVLEYSVDMPEANLDGLTCGWALALADNDGSGRDYQLYPITGQNDSYKGINLGTLVCGTASDKAEPLHVLVPFKAKPAKGEITLDGKYTDGEWADAVKHQLVFNQLNTRDERFNKDYNDLYGEWGALYNGSILYGYVIRKDDKLNTGAGNEWENDCVEVFVDVDSKFAQLRTLVNKDFGGGSYECSAVWSADGSVLEYMVNLGKPVAGSKIGFNIALADNDGGESRESQLYPVFGFNDCYKGINLAELEFVK